MSYLTRYRVLFLVFTMGLAPLICICQTNKPVVAASLPPPLFFPLELRPGGYPTGVTLNSITIKEAIGAYDETNFNGQDFNHVKQSTQYVDGLGRPIQTVAKQATPGTSPTDMVVPGYYDGSGQESVKVLAYPSPSSDGKFKMNPFYEQNYAFASAYPGEQTPYSKTDFEASPLKRPVKSYSPGNSWVGSHVGIEQQYMTNTGSDAVRVWSIDYNSDFSLNIPVSSAIYSEGTLMKNITIDEHGGQVVEYKDKVGHVILKKVELSTTHADSYDGWLSTYYVYDDFGNLRFVMPPRAVKLILTNWQLTDVNIISELCFRYEYDSQKRMIAKKVPGAGWVNMIYDKRDRLIFTQDANMSSIHQWHVTLYDEINRPVLTGMITYSGSISDLQAYVDANTSGGGSSDIVTNGTLSGSPLVDITINQLQQNLKDYRASNSITLDAGFDSDNSTDLTAEIVSTTGQSFSNTVTVNNNPVPPGSTLIGLTISYYDDYQWTTKTYNTSYNGQITPGNNQNPVSLPSTAFTNTRGIVTGAAVRTLPDPSDLSLGKWMRTVNFYDDRGRVVQTQSENYRGGLDIVTNQYNFTGAVLCNYLVENNPQEVTVPLQTIHVKTNMEYDASGHLLEIRKGVNEGVQKLVSKSEYDALSQQIKKSLGTNPVTTDPVEVLDYSYNIRGWLRGINKDYAKGVSGTDRWFGMELNYDWGFDHNQLNGNIAGTRWRSKGDGAQRSYGFGYDRVNRLLYGDFAQMDGAAYSDNTIFNFDMKMGDGTNPRTAYDENGNIVQMQQWGLKVNASTQIDNLKYTYEHAGVSNKLQNVIDANNDINTKLGDFRTSTHHPQLSAKNDVTTDPNTVIDYRYDDNGNLKKDLNKDIGEAALDGIIYNHLNLPWQIKVKDPALPAPGEKGTITYIYDATGNKLEKIVKETTSTPKTTSTCYLGGFIYENNELQFFSHEEGRIRPDLSNYAHNQLIAWNYDYFIKDHLGNIRMVLTDQLQQDNYPAVTLEGTGQGSDPVNVEKNFYSIDDANVALKTEAAGITDYPNNNGNPPVNNNPNCNDNSAIKQSDLSQKLYRLNGSTNKTGLGITLKVMAGDRVDVFGKSYYLQNNSGGSGVNLQPTIAEIIGGLLGTPTGVTAGKASASDLSSNTGGTVNPITGFLNDPNRDDANHTQKPRAFINWILLDDQFRFVTGNFSPVSDIPGLKNQHHEDPSLQNIAVTKNGYIYVYVSNESPVNVYFDNLQVIHTRGPLLEETHYYPWGLSMTGISSKAAGGLENKKRYNGKELQNKEFSDGSGLEEYEFGKRFQDLQIGRWNVLDPKADLLEMSTPFAFCYNNPINYMDPNGELAILINGRVASNSERGNISYWAKGVIDAIQNSGIPYSGNIKYVDGDRYRVHLWPYSNGDYDEWGPVQNGSYTFGGNSAEGRRKAGEEIAKEDFADIMSKLARDTKSKKIIEKIQIYTHSRGGAFGAGYIDALISLIQKNAGQFEDPTNEIDLVYNMSPNEADRDGTSEPHGLNSYSHHHDGDLFSGTGMHGTKENFSSNEGGSLFGRHSINSFVKDVTEFTKAFAGSKGDNKKMVNAFITNMQTKYGIKVTLN